MRIFVAGASGIIGLHLVPLFVEAGHVVGGMTRTPEKKDLLRSLGAEPIVCDVFDVARLRVVVREFAPDVVADELTDLPDDPSRIPEFAAANARMRTEGSRNLLAAAGLTGKYIAQSVAWQLPGDAGAAVAEHEQSVLEVGGVVLRYGQLYGPGTYYETELPDHPRIDVADAARLTLPALDAPSGVIVVAEDPSASFR